MMRWCLSRSRPRKINRPRPISHRCHTLPPHPRLIPAAARADFPQHDATSKSGIHMVTEKQIAAISAAGPLAVHHQRTQFISPQKRPTPHIPRHLFDMESHPQIGFVWVRFGLKLAFRTTTPPRALSAAPRHRVTRPSQPPRRLTPRPNPFDIVKSTHE